jgi:hypothetical protein
MASKRTNDRPVPKIFSGGSHRAPKARESRRRGGRVRGGDVPLPAEKFLYFTYESDAFWCIFGGVGVKIRLPIPHQKTTQISCLNYHRITVKHIPINGPPHRRS